MDMEINLTREQTEKIIHEHIATKLAPMLDPGDGITVELGDRYTTRGCRIVVRPRQKPEAE